jgi:hypothetical protein
MARKPLEISKLANDAALHFLARRREYDFSDEVRQHLIQVVLGFTGRCDETAARRGMEWMREHYRAKGETPRFAKSRHVSQALRP